MKKILFITYIIWRIGFGTTEDSFSFFKFFGPVSGQIKEIFVPDASGIQRVDYVAKPEYSYHYGVQDDQSGNSLGHKESRDGDDVHGEYRVLQADGMVRIVRYVADPYNGFKASIDYVSIK